MRTATVVVADPSLEWDAVRMTVELADGRQLTEEVAHCVGSPESPMSDSEITDKFVAQAGLAIGYERATDLVASCWSVKELPNVSALAEAAR